ncbi:MAG: Na+/H+ antiporter NhaA [Coriobacteriales bacterium]
MTEQHDDTDEREDFSDTPIIPGPDNPDPDGLYIDAVQGRNKRLRQLIKFTHSSTKAAAIMLVAAIIALIVANTPAHGPFLEFWHTEVSIGIGAFHGEMSFAHIINDIFMAVFFLLVGLEIKYEMTAGELTNIRQAILPILGALGGVLAPIGIYLIFNASHPEAFMGWGVPTATDIAFALGILSLLGSRVPNGVRVFLSTLAVADDIIAILVIAIFYGESPDLLWLGLSAVVFVALIVMNRMHVYSLVPYVLVGCVLWFCVFSSGIHSTIAGVLLAFAIPSGSRVNLDNFFSWSKKRLRMANSFYEGDETPLVAQKDYITTVTSLSKVSKQAVPPATRLEHKLYPWVYFLILPLFALTNADVALTGLDMSTIASSPVVLGVFCGLVLGKPIGIMLFSFITVKTKIASLPEFVTWRHMFGAAVLGGVGFTMAIFVANLAYADAALITEAKLSILAASTVAGVVGFVLLFMQAKADQRRGISYVTIVPEDGNVTHADAELAHDSEELVDELGDEELAKRVREASEHADAPAALKVEVKGE